MTSNKTDVFAHQSTITRSQGEVNSTLIQRDIDYFLNRLEVARAHNANGSANRIAEATAYAALRSVWERITMSYLEAYGVSEHKKIEALFDEETIDAALRAWKVLNPFLYVKGLLKFDTVNVIDFSDLEEVNEAYGH